jgi:hypothetical protein
LQTTQRWTIGYPLGIDRSNSHIIEGSGDCNERAVSRLMI